MPSAVMLLHLGSLSNLMKRSAAVFLIYSLPKNPNDSLEEGDGGEVSASPTPPSHLLSYWALKEENGSMVTFR